MQNSKKKVLIIGPLPPPLAGPEIVTNNLINTESFYNSFDTHVINTSFRKSNTDKGRIGIQIVFAYFSYLFRFIRSVLVFRPQIVFYLPTSASLVGWVRDGTTIFLSYLFRRNTVILMQGGHFRFFFNDCSQFFKSVIAFLLRKCNRVFVQSERLKFQFSDIVRNEQIGVFHNFIDPDFLRDVENTGSCNHDRVNILFIGHLTSAKGYCDLLKVVPSISNADFTIMGSVIKNPRNIRFNQETSNPLINEDPQSIYQEHIVKNRLEERVDYLGGNVAGERKLDAFRKADIFILPSYSEGFSTAILEAMAAGLPIVATNVGAAPDFIENEQNGYIVSPGDLDALVEALQKLVADKSMRERMGERNRRICVERFSSAVVINSLIVQLKAVD